MDYWGGKYIFVCKACDKLGGSGGMLPREILSFITRNLVESGAFFNIIHHLLCHYKAFIKVLRVISAYPGGRQDKAKGLQMPPHPERNPANLPEKKKKKKRL